MDVGDYAGYVGITLGAVIVITLCACFIIEAYGNVDNEYPRCPTCMREVR